MRPSSQGPIPLFGRDRAEMSRRRALQLLAYGMASAKAGCSRPPGDALKPYVKQPENTVLGRAQYYATSMSVDGFATGLVVESHDGRPTKIEGNPLHPGSLGATSALHQASIYELYDPHRAQAVTKRGAPSSWSELHAALAQHRSRPLWLVLPADSSPLHGELVPRLLAKRPDTHVVRLDSEGHRVRYVATELLFGRPLETQRKFGDARLVVSLDEDFVATGPMSVRWARDFAGRRRPSSPNSEINRLYVAEPMPTPTGSLADHRLAIAAGDLPALVMALVDALRAKGVSLPELPTSALEPARARVDALGARRWVELLAADLHDARGESLIVIGNRQPAFCHALVHLLNVGLGNLNRTCFFTEPTLLDPLPTRTLEHLADAIDQNEVGCLVVLADNPVYASSPELRLGERFLRVPLSVHVSLHHNETSRACAFHGPLSHYLESWGDARAFDGTMSIVQPLVRTLVDSRTASEILANLAGDQHPSARLLLHEFWRARLSSTDFEARWATCLARGLLDESAWSPQHVETPNTDRVLALAARFQPRSRAQLELDLARSPRVLDGSFSGNAWLQELPHPVTKLTWSNAALLAPETARAHGIEDGQVVQLKVNERQVEAPALLVPGHVRECVTLELGYGRSSSDEPIAHGAGTNGYLLMSRSGELVLPGLVVEPTNHHTELAITQRYHDQEQRDLVHAATQRTWRERPEGLVEAAEGALPSFHDFEAASPLHWAMTIDTTICTGCGACVVACQAENNIPVVGAEGVRRGREMHWLRIDSYRVELPEVPLGVVHQPMLCQHCEHAPCEYVCPVFATTHSPDGLNEMVYNRCVGTRFCSNNCPYKVRRFNWFNYTSDSGSLKLQRNPDVTVRERGVMEKCTYCVQRIRRAEIKARMERRSIEPGEVRTACQQACPTQAIQFGALEHEGTPMVQWRAETRAYSALRELGARPRTRYLAKIYNPSAGGGA